VVKLAGDSGAPEWAFSLGGTDNEFPGGVAVGAGGKVVVAGHYLSTPLEIGAESFGNQGEGDIFVVKLSQ